MCPGLRLSLCLEVGGGVLSVLSTPNSLPSISPHFPLVPRKGLLLVWSERVKFMGWKSYPEAVH